MAIGKTVRKIVGVGRSEMRSEVRGTLGGIYSTRNKNRPVHGTPIMLTKLEIMLPRYCIQGLVLLEVREREFSS